MELITAILTFKKLIATVSINYILLKRYDN